MISESKTDVRDGGGETRGGCSISFRLNGVFVVGDAPLCGDHSVVIRAFRPVR